VQRGERARALVEAATSGRRDRAEALLALDPGLARETLDAALVLGAAERVASALARDGGAARRSLGVRGWQPLLYVASSAFLGVERTDGLLACAQALLAAGADPNDGASLAAAARADDPACLRLLLDAGASLHRSMALRSAARAGAIECARVLVQRGPERWSERTNALQWAVHAEASPAMIELLVEHGADLEASYDGTGRTPYGVAVRCGRRDLTELLVSRGARRRAAPLDELLGACVAGDRAEARRVAAAQPSAATLLRTAEAGELARAASAGRRATVEILLELGVPVDARGVDGATALQAARERGDAQLAALLLQRGADPGKRPPVDEPADDDPAYAELAWAAEAAYLRLLASSPLAESRPCGDGVAVITGIHDNTENGVVCDRLDGDVDTAIAETLAWFVARDAPAQWLIADRLQPSDLCARLVAAGADAERSAVVMGAPIEAIARDEPAPAGIEIARVRDEAALAEWMTVAGAFVLDAAQEEKLERRAAIIASLGLGAETPLRLHVARRAGRVVGVASSFVHGETVLGQHLGVLPVEQRAGVGRALVHVAAREARDAGARVVVLGPTPETIAFYRLLGFGPRAALRDRSLYLPLG